MKYIETPPSDKFRDLILNYWMFQIPESVTNNKPFIHDIMPESNISIVFINQPYYKGIRFLGPQTKRYQQQIFPGSTYLGIRFNPWVKMDNIISKKELITNKTSSSPDFLNNVFKEINIEELKSGFNNYSLLEDGLFNLIENKKLTIDPIVKYICIQLSSDLKVSEAIKEIPLSIRPLQKKFKSVTGITMSDFKSINRIQNTVRMIFNENDNITTAAFKNSYADHAHFLNTFKRYMNTSIRAFIEMTEKIELQIER